MKKTHTRHITLPAIALALVCAYPQPSHAKGPAGLSDAAQREIARRMNNVQLSLLEEGKGDAKMAEDDCLAAQGFYKEAMNFLEPVAPATRESYNRVAAKYADASVCVAKELAEGGRYDEALTNLELALTFDPDHRGANELMRKLNDPEIYPPARTPEHVANVQSVQRLLIEARSSWELGKFDEAEKTYEQVLRIDPYNSTARRGMTRVSQSRSDYYTSAYTDRRAAALAEVEAMWERPVPVMVSRDGMAGAGRPVTDLRDQITARLRNIVIPEVQFVDATIEEAVEFLRFKSTELDTTTTDPARKGVNILINAAGMDPAATPRITLDLRQVPLEEALRYVTELAGMRYKVEAYAVMVVPASSTATDEMFVRTFTSVPPDFLSGGGGGGGGGAVDLDPFAPQPGGGGGGGLAATPTAQEVLTGVGVTFPPGSSATFNRSTAQLIVRNTQPNLDVIEAYVDGLRGTQPKMIYLTTKFIEVSQKDTDELGFDWLVGAFSMGGSDNVYGSGGTVGNSLAGGIDGVDFPFVPPVPPGSQGLPVGRNPLTRGLRSGSNAITPDSIDGLLRGTALASGTAPGIFALAGIFTDPEFQTVIRALNQRKGADLMSAPSVTTRSGQRATIEIIREFIYPTEFDPPEIPQTFGNGGLGGGGGGGIIPGLNLAQVSSFPVTPSTPVAFEMRPVGVTMEVDPVLGDDGFTIDLNLAPEVVEFEGFINYGSPIQAGAVDALGNPTTVTLTENRIEQPVFATRKVTTAVTIWDGQTVGLGGLIREDVQSVHDKVPFLGDLPLIGRLFQSKSEDHFKRNLMIFVTARLIGPDGQPLSAPEEPGEALAPAVPGGGPVSPLMPQGPIDMGGF